LREAGLEYISWRLRTYDTILWKSGDLASRILDNVTSGDIILMHDRRASGADVMVNALPGVIDKLRSRGFEFVLVGAGPDVRAQVAAQ
jgi:peptidoglycan/xylan/chitin deacetylase (PgdA/CDA1 family)